jgi:AAA ATPase domain
MMSESTKSYSASNPFRPGMGLDPPYLADRGPELERFARYLAGFPSFPRNVRLTGLRGVGKTVLLYRCARLAERTGWVVIQRECSEHLRQERGFGLALVDDCRRAVEGAARFSTRAIAAFEATLQLLGGISVSLAGITVSLRRATRETTDLALEDRLFEALSAAAETVVAAGRSGIVLCYDEGQLLRDTRWLGQYPLSAFLSAVARCQRQGVPVMLLLGGLPTLTENLGLARSYSERMFQAEEIGALRPPEDLRAFTRPLLEAGREYQDQVAEAVRADTEGYPFYIQFYGALLWEATPWPDPVTTDVFRASRPQILAALDRAFFDARLARTSRGERSVLSAIAAGGSEATSLGDLRARMGASNRGVAQPIARLIDRGLVYRPARGQLAFSVPLFGDYLRRRGDLLEHR